MRVYQTKSEKLTGTEFKEVQQKAHEFYKQLKNRSRRRAYVRSTYFSKEKVFIDIFWQHLFEKPNWRDRVRRLKFFPPAIELIRNSRFAPSSQENPNRRSEILHRFAGVTKGNDLFFVQIKEDKRTSRKYLISIFPSA